MTVQAWYSSDGVAARRRGKPDRPITPPVSATPVQMRVYKIGADPNTPATGDAVFGGNFGGNF